MAENAQFSAHPKRDPQTGAVLNFGVSIGARDRLQLYCCDRRGHLVRQQAIPLSRKSLVHDCTLAGPYLVFVLPPAILNVWPVLFKLKSYSEALTWQPQQGTQLLIVDRERLQIAAKIEADPWFQWHFANGYWDERGWITCDFVRYDDFQTNQFLQEVPSGAISTYAKGSLWRAHIDPQAGRLLETYPLCDRHCEFPSVAPREVGRPHRYIYLTVHPRDRDPHRELFSAVARLDCETGELMETELEQGCYVSEPLFLPHPDDAVRGWVATTVYDSHRDRSEVYLYASDRLNEVPVCRLALPSVIPIGFHGTWHPAHPLE